MVGTFARKKLGNSAFAAFMACVVGLGPMVHASSASYSEGPAAQGVIDCGPGRTGPTLRLTRQVRPADGRQIVTIDIANAAGVGARGATFSEDLSGSALGDSRASAGRLAFTSPLLKWTGDLAAGAHATVQYAVRPGKTPIRTVDADAGTTCQAASAAPKSSPKSSQADDAKAQRRSSSKAHKAPITFSQRYADSYRGAVTRAGNTVMTCYPPAVADCLTRQNGTGNNSVAAQYVDVDGDPSTFDSSTADLQLTPGAQVATARLYWGGRSETTTDTPGLPPGNRFSPAIAQRGQVRIKAPGGGYQTITATPGSIGDTPDNVTAAGIVYGASADVTSLVASAGAGTYSVGNIQAGQGFDGLGAFGGWSLVVAYRDPALPLRNISIFDGFLEQQNGNPDTTINLSGFQTATTGPVNVQLGQIAYDGDNAIVGDSLLVKSTNGPLTTLTDALHPPNNFFNSTIANLGSQVTARNPTFTNTLGYDSNIINASSAFVNGDTSAQFTFRTTGDAYWPHAFFTQTDLHQAEIQMTKSAQVVGGGTPGPGSVVEYTSTATNTGDDNAVNVLFSDPIPANTTYVPGTISIASGPNTGPKTDQVGDDQGEFVGNAVHAQLGNGATAFAGGSLTPGQSTSVKFRVTLGPNSPGTTVTNTATVTFASADIPTDVGTASATATVNVPAAVPSLALLKTASPVTFTRSGRLISYSFLVVNTGNTVLTGLSVADTAFSGTGPPPVITCPVTTLAPGAQTTCTATYTSTQADVDAGAIVDTATATGTPPTGPPETSAPSTATVTAITTSALALLKTASPSALTTAGQTITYSYLVTNTGNTSLTLLNVVDTSFTGTGTPPTINCPVVTLAPQASTTCTGTYTVTQADIDAGSIVDTATATATPPTGPPVTSPPSTATVTAAAAASLSLLKTASPITFSSAGRTVTYSFLVINTGNTTLTGVGAADTSFSGTGPPPVITCPVTTLAPGVSTTCTGTYVTTQADVDAGSVSDTATATGTPPTGPAVTSNPSSVTITSTPHPSLALLKTAVPSTVTTAGQTVTYSFAVTNNGNTSLTLLNVVDTSFSGTGPPPTITCPVTTLAPDASTTCTGTYTVTQADIDAGSIVDTAIASATAPGGGIITSPPSTATVTATMLPTLALLKTASPSSVTAAGQTVTYSYAVTNTGNTTLTGVSATDTTFSGTGTPPVITCPVTTLVPGAFTTCTGTYTVTQADIDAGFFTDTATASGTPPTGPAVTSNPSTFTVDTTPGPSLALLKAATPSTVTSAGQIVTYHFQVTNTGNTTLTGVSAADTSFTGTGTPPVITCPVTTLAPDASTTCTGTYVVTQADIDAGSIVDTATATGTPPVGPAVTSNPSTATVTVDSNPSIALLKTVSPITVTAAGRTVTYSFLVTNTGNTNLTGVSATDTAFSGTGTPPVITCPVTTLAPGAATTCTGTYVVTQADVDAGTVVNTATASGTPPTGPAVTSAPSTATITSNPTPALALLKTADPTSVTSAGQIITYSFWVTNTGNTTLTNVSAADTSFSGTGPPPVITCPVTPLAPQATTICTGTYVTTQADINAGSIVNTGTTTGTPPTGPAVTSDPATATVTATAAPSIALLKTVTPATLSTAGRTVTYSYAITNTGNTDLTGVSATDTAFSGTGTPPVITCPVTTLAPQATTICTGTYISTQADVDAGSIVDTATASGTPPTGPAVTSALSTATITVTATPALALLKTASPSAVASAGQVVTYSYMLTNTGNTTLTGVTAADTAFSGTGTPPVITCPVSTLAPQETTTCTGTYVTTQADINAGSIVNTATATGIAPTGETVTAAPSTATVTATALPALALLKSADPAVVTTAGQMVTYSFLVTNAGNTTLTGISVTDTSFSGSGPPPVISCPATTLQPQESTTCTATYPVTQTDIDAGSVVDTATATGTPPTGPAVTSDPSTATVTATAAPALALLKSASPASVTAAGQIVTYSYLVTNTGNTTLTGVNAADTAFSGTGTPPVITCPLTTLEPQDSTTCTGTYIVTQADIDAGSFTDTATATGTPPGGEAITSNPSTATVTATAAPALTLEKSASPTTVTAAGQVVTYSFLVTNTGNTTLTGVTAADTAFSGTGTPPVITCPVTTLAPLAFTTCTGSYSVTQADIDAGSITNTGVATGTPPTGPAVTSNPSTATVTATAAPALTLAKTASPTTVTAAGQIVTYSFLATNTGNTTLTGVTAADTVFSGTGTPPVITCPVTTLAPLATTTCTGTYTVTQADIDAGSITNTGVATGTPPTGPAVTSNPSTATVTATAAPALTLAKSASPTVVTAAGQVVTYSYLVTNTGNTTLTSVSATDSVFSGTGTPTVITCPVTTLAPLASTTCTGTYTVTQADIDAGSVTNAATASGTPPTGPRVTSALSIAVVTTAPSAALTVVKTATPARVTEPGQMVTFHYLVTNTGTTPLSGVGATDILFSGSGGRPVVTCPVTTLAPGASTDCTGMYTVTRRDAAAGTISDTAIAYGTTPGGVRVTSDPSTAVVVVTYRPGRVVRRPGGASAVAHNGNDTVTDLDVTRGRHSRSVTVTHSRHAHRIHHRRK